MQRFCGYIPVGPVGRRPNQQAVPLPIGHCYPGFYRVAECTKAGGFDINDDGRQGLSCLTNSGRDRYNCTLLPCHALSSTDTVARQAFRIANLCHRETSLS